MAHPTFLCQFYSLASFLSYISFPGRMETAIYFVEILIYFELTTRGEDCSFFFSFFL